MTITGTVPYARSHREAAALPEVLRSTVRRTPTTTTSPAEPDEPDAPQPAGLRQAYLALDSIRSAISIERSRARTIELLAAETHLVNVIRALDTPAAPAAPGLPADPADMDHVADDMGPVARSNDAKRWLLGASSSDAILTPPNDVLPAISSNPSFSSSPSSSSPSHPSTTTPPQREDAQ